MTEEPRCLCSAVVRSKCPSYVGLSGILLQEFKHVFKIITAEDRLKGEQQLLLAPSSQQNRSCKDWNIPNRGVHGTMELPLASCLM